MKVKGSTLEVKLIESQQVIEKMHWSGHVMDFTLILLSDDMARNRLAVSVEAQKVNSLLASSVQKEFGRKDSWKIHISAKWSNKKLMFTVDRGEVAKSLLKMSSDVKLQLNLTYLDKSEPQGERQVSVTLLPEKRSSELFKGVKTIEKRIVQALFQNDASIKSTLSYIVPLKLIRKMTSKPSKDAMSVNRRMLKEKLGCDVTIETKGGRVKCHKIFMITHSKVWRAMFQMDCVETSTGIIKMEDMTLDGVRALLEFLYCGDVAAAEEKSSIALQLLSAGQRYQIGPLEKDVKELLLRKPNDWFDLEDLPQIYIIAQGMNEGRGDSEVIAMLIGVIRSNGLAVKDSPAFLAFFKSTPEMALQFFADQNVFG